LGKRGRGDSDLAIAGGGAGGAGGAHGGGSLPRGGGGGSDGGGDSDGGGEVYRPVRRVTHFPAHRAEESAGGALSVAKRAQDALGGRGGAGRHSSRRAQHRPRPPRGGLHRGSDRDEEAREDGGGGPGEKRRRRLTRDARERRSMETRLELRRLAQLRRALSEQSPEGFEAYFA
jgi:hypothetical protein